MSEVDEQALDVEALVDDSAARLSEAQLGTEGAPAAARVPPSRFQPQPAAASCSIRPCYNMRNQPTCTPAIFMLLAPCLPRAFPPPAAVATPTGLAGQLWPASGQRIACKGCPILASSLNPRPRAYSSFLLPAQPAGDRAVPEVAEQSGLGGASSPDHPATGGCLLICVLSPF